MQTTPSLKYHVYFLDCPYWPRLSPPAPSNHSVVVSRNAIETAPNSGWRWPIERLFDRLRGAAARRTDLAEPGHRLIGVVEIEPLGARHAHPAAPVIGMAVGTRDHQPVQHREIDRALDIEGKAPVGDEALQRVAASRFRP